MALLDKLAGHKTEEDEMVSIIDNLNNIFNTKRGYGFFLQDFGISDYHHLSYGNNINEMIIAELAENITRFEPRIELVKIEAIHEEGGGRQFFQIDCLVRSNAYSLKVFLEPIRKGYRVNL